MDSQKQDGIQKLLQAEQEANAIVTAARQGGLLFSNCCVFFIKHFLRPRLMCVFGRAFLFLIFPSRLDVRKKDKNTTNFSLFFPLNKQTEKTARIKQAKDEAEAEIQSYRNQREQQFQHMLAQATGGSDELAKELETKAKRAEANMRATIEKNGANVTGMLVKHVTSVQL